MQLPRGALLTSLRLSPEDPFPLYRQLSEALRERILDGTLPPGTRLPSTRILAGELAVSRNTVKGAYEQLQDEGYIDSRVGAGSRVSSVLPDSALAVGRPAEGSGEAASRPPRLSRRGAGMLAQGRLPEPDRSVPFAPGIPALDGFPSRLWNRIAAQVQAAAGPEELMHAPAQGLASLRRQVAAYLGTARGVRCTADTVLILSSSQQALDLASRVLLDPGDAAWIEEPGYLGARGALDAAGARLMPVPVDDEGLIVSAGRKLAPEARLAYVTPSHQYPLGSVLSLGRRFELLAWAREANAWILEDDYDSEYRYRGQPVPALQGLDPEGRVIYVGTFTKVLFPSLRLAYLVCPAELMPAFVAARSLQDGHAPARSQAVTAEFLSRGSFAAHLRRMRSLYSRRQEILRELLETRLGEWVVARPSVAGMHLVAQLRRPWDDVALSAEATRRGLHMPPLSRTFLGSEGTPGLLLGYTAFDEAAMGEGATALEGIFRELTGGPPGRSSIRR
jgi:GntR family transcriptional regulator / MocR family aminotransferase